MNTSKLFLKSLLLIFVLVVSCNQSIIDTAGIPSRNIQERPLTAENRGTYEDFLISILTFESDIDPADAAQYYANYVADDAYYYEYQEVESPGRVVRDNDGNPVTKYMNLKEFFTTLGILVRYQPYNRLPSMFRYMQYGVVNYLGFIGYQFSEADLESLGYYEFARDEYGIPYYYSDVPVSNWANGVREKLMWLKQEDGGYALVHVTDVNRWNGTFTGKNGVASINAFKSNHADYIAVDHFQFKFNNMEKLLGEIGHKVSDYIGETLYWDQLKPKLTPPPGIPNAVVVSYSGLLAGAHLRGAEGVFNLLVNHENPQDENGTAILSYVYRFRDYQTPFGVNGENLTQVKF